MKYVIISSSMRKHRCLSVLVFKHKSHIKTSVGTIPWSFEKTRPVPSRGINGTGQEWIASMGRTSWWVWGGISWIFCMTGFFKNPFEKTRPGSRPVPASMWGEFNIHFYKLWWIWQILYPSIQIAIGSSVSWDDGIINLTSIASHPYQIIGAVDGTRTNISSFTVSFFFETRISGLWRVIIRWKLMIENSRNWSMCPFIVIRGRVRKCFRQKR